MVVTDSCATGSMCGATSKYLSTFIALPRAINLRLSATALALFFLRRTGVAPVGRTGTKVKAPTSLPVRHPTLPPKKAALGNKAKPLAAYRADGFAVCGFTR